MRLETTHDPINVNGKPTGYILRILSPYLSHHVHVSIVREDVPGSIVQAVGENKENTTTFLWRVIQMEADRVRRSRLPVDNTEHILALEALLRDRQRYEDEANLRMQAPGWKLQRSGRARRSSPRPSPIRQRPLSRFTCLSGWRWHASNWRSRHES